MDSVKKAFLAGVGALSLSSDRAKKIIQELVRQGQLHEQEGRELVEDMMAKASVVRRDVEQKIGQQVKSATQNLNLTLRAQLKKMERRLHELERSLAKASGEGRTSKKKASHAKAKPSARKH
jgi:polyhydroxyalkanoate synthesis regulator phasin